METAGQGPKRISEHIIEIVSDSGEGAQKAGQTFGSLSAKMGNGVWTVEIIPAEIKPPARSKAGASGIRIRFGDHQITNMGDEADLVVAFNGQVLYGRFDQHAYKAGTILLIESKWANDPVPEIREQYAAALEMFKEKGLIIHELPFEDACLEITPNPRLGKNMFVLGMLSYIYQRDLQIAKDNIAYIFRKKAQKVVDLNHALLDRGYAFAKQHVPTYCWEVPGRENPGATIVSNGNEAAAMGIMAAGIELVAMYPITPATSVSHFLAEHLYKVGGFMHQAEDESAAAGFAIGASYAGLTAATITSGPGLALKTEMLGLATMAEVPLVVVLVQRGGPSTGLPTKVEQSDLLAVLYGQAGDAPKIAIASSTIEECFHDVILARKLAEEYRTPVYVLSDTNLATGVSQYPRPELKEEWLAAPLDQSDWPEGVRPYEWDPNTGLSPRPVPGQRGGEYTLTGLAHTEESHVAYDPEVNQRSSTMRSLKFATLQRTLTPPEIKGEDQGDLLIVGWGSTRGSIEEAVLRAQKDGYKVSSTHIRIISPMQPGLKEMFKKFKQVITVEINYSDPAPGGNFTEENRRRAQLAQLLREQTLMDIDSWSNVHGQPIRPGLIYNEIVRRLAH
ncbi:MAG: 2-oxoacid:acceptor oxidoreductase subunit alpha [Deltaproteobacteria bacterium]|nr:2-oxoacid:acceptor oxidoreductase subunit alpha [Deltaproteobacteria bacterium]